MKRIYSLVVGFAAFGALSLNAQNHVIIGTKPVQKVNHPMVEKTSGVWYMDYDAYDASLNTVDHYAGITDGTYGYQHNDNDTLTGSFAVAYTRFDTVITTSDFSTFNFTNNSDVWSIVVDSAFLWLDHQNNSGQNDTISVSLVGLDGSRRPNDNDVLWSFDEVTNTSLNQGVISWNPNITRNGSNWGFAMRVRYHGAPTDTFNVIFGQMSNCSPSEVYPVCYYRVNIGPANSILIPTSSNAGYWYQDCNGNNQADWPDENSFSHWGMWLSITLAEDVGVEEQENKGINVMVYPNPANEVANIRIELENAGDVTMNVTDLSGKVIANSNLGHRNAGTHIIPVNTTEYANGIYLFTLDVDGTKITRRIVVNK